MKVKIRNNKIIITSDANPILILQEKDARELHRRLEQVLKKINNQTVTTINANFDDFFVIDPNLMPPGMVQADSSSKMDVSYSIDWPKEDNP